MNKLTTVKSYCNVVKTVVLQVNLPVRHKNVYYNILYQKTYSYYVSEYAFEENIVDSSVGVQLCTFVHNTAHKRSNKLQTSVHKHILWRDISAEQEFDTPHQFNFKVIRRHLKTTQLRLCKTINRFALLPLCIILTKFDGIFDDWTRSVVRCEIYR